MSKRFLFCIISILFFSQLVAGTVFAQISSEQERILDFSSNIKVNQDASILVTEDIIVYANGQTIKHGIYRDFPTIYKDDSGNKYTVGFEVKEVKVNDVAETYTVSSLSNGKRIKIGKADVLLSPGVYKYSITYQATRELGFFSDHDELYWNVTGNGWNYNLEKVSAVVTLPNNINEQDIKTEAYTGVMGSKEKAYNTSITQNVGSFSTNRVLSPYEGLTIVISWPKGFVTAPTNEQLRNYWLQDNQGIIFGLIGLLVTFLYYIFVWRKYGRDPKKNTIIAEYEPVKDISPAVARYLIYRKIDDKCMVADIIDLAVKGYLKIDKTNGGYTLTITDKKYDDQNVVSSQKILLESLFSKKDIIKIGGSNNSIVSIKNKFSKWIKANYGKDYFTNNTRYVWVGLILSIIFIIFSIIKEGIQILLFVGFISIWLFGWSFGVVSMLSGVVKLWIGRNNFQAIFLSFFSIPFLVVEFGVIYMIYNAVSLGFLVFLVLFIALNIVFYFLLKQYTQNGIRLVEKINGFKLFLSVTEKDRMNFHNPPERTPELFERYLPYALALGVENKWAEQFADVFRDKDMMNNHPLWCSSSIYSTAFISDFSSSFSGSISASATAPGSHSGGGGGGSSGGGGGGGGGGGW
jgi:uncharacterized membrane protein YgcG